MGDLVKRGAVDSCMLRRGSLLAMRVGKGVCGQSTSYPSHATTRFLSARRDASQRRGMKGLCDGALMLFPE